MAGRGGFFGLFGGPRGAAPMVAAPAVPAPAPAAVAGRRTDITPSLNHRVVTDLQKRFYRAAEDNRFTIGMPGISMSPDQVTLRTLRKLRARSRYEVANNDIAKRAIALYDTNVIGQGITLQGQVVDDNGDPDEMANRAIEDGWREWCRPGNCAYADDMSFWDIMRLFNLSSLVDGEALVRLHVGRDAGPWGVQVQLIDPELLEVQDCRQLAGGNWVRMGIEYSAIGRPVAYWIVEPNPSQGLLSYGYTGRTAKRHPSDALLHRFMRERVGQSRGTPMLATCLMRLAHIEGSEEAAILAMRIGASKLGWIKRGPGGGYQGEDQGVEDPTNPDSPVHRIIDADIGSLGELPYDASIEKWDPGYPNNEYAPMQKRLLQNTGSGTNLPYFMLGNDLEGVNYSSAKIGQMDAHDTFRTHQRYVIEGLCMPVFDIWLKAQLLTGRLRFPDTGAVLPATKIDKYRRVRFQARAWEGADRLKEVMGDQLAIESMQDTLTSVILKRSGRDFYEVLKERDREIKAMAALGIPQSPKMNEQLIAMALASGEEGKGNAQDRP